MADIRALMAQERQARRINHEFAAYSKAGVLMCSACGLNIKAESLWDGHLRSLNHRNNVKKLHDNLRATIKRKIEDVDNMDVEDDSDPRKKLKPKSRTISQRISTPPPDDSLTADNAADNIDVADEGSIAVRKEPTIWTSHSMPQVTNSKTVPLQEVVPVAVDEDEWAAFERDVAPLAQPDYSAATITAAPVTAAQIEAEAESDRKKLRDTEADDEKEEEGRRMEEEFDVMEEMEERVKKLKEKREALRLLGRSGADAQKPETVDTVEGSAIYKGEAERENDDEGSDEDVDDWYS